MAKRKTKKEAVIDLKPKAEKITEQELAKLQATIKTMDQLTGEVGVMEVRKYSMMRAMDQIQGTIEKLRSEFREKYGTDNVNIKEGTITYPENNKTNQKENGEINKKD